MRDVVSSFAATAFIQAANIGSGILLARILQPDGRGELAAVMLWPAVIAGLGIWGLHEAVAYHAARRSHDPGRILRAGLLLAAGLAALLLAVGWAVVDVVFAGRDAEVYAAALLYLGFIPLNFLSLVLVGVFQGRQRFGEWNWLRCSVHLFYLALIPVFAVAGLASVWGFAAASLAANALTLIAAAILAWRAGWLTGRAPASAGVSVPRELLRYGGSVHIGAAIAVVAERLDQMIISVALSAAELGLYVVAATVSRLPLVLALTLATVAFPKIAAAAAADRPHILARYTRATTLGVLAAAVGLAVVVPWLLPAFFGQAFAAATPVAWVLLIGAVPLGLKAMLGAGLKACDQGLLVGRLEVVTLILSTAALAALIPPFGLMGAAIAGVVAQTGALAYAAAKTRRLLDVRTADLFRPGRGDLAPIGDIVATARRRVGRRSGGA